MPTDDGVPQELKDEVDRIRQEEGGEAGGDQEEGGEERVKLSRRQAAKQRTEEKEAAETARANEILEATRATAEEAKQLRADRAKDAERMARLEGLLEATVVSQRQQVYQQPRGPEPEPAETVYRKKMRDASAALAAGKLDDYHDLQREANEAIVDERIRAGQQQVLRQIPVPQQQFQKPDWVSAVEAQFGDVVMHPSGQNAVANFHSIMYGPNSRPTPESLHKAYVRAQDELGLGNKEDPAKIERKRAMLAGGRVNGSNKTSGGGKEEFVNVPKNYKEIARRAGMKPEDYLRSYAESNPKDVSRG